jgi:hypothetical protein
LREIYIIILGLSLIYPLFYDLTQLVKGGLTNYLSDKWNYLDMLLTWGSVLNIILQLTEGPRQLSSELIMIILSLALIVKVFFFLRIF